ncbi:hypothetical protein [Pedobacter sp. SYP-B3415]|uniref:hypothetical protein n=1 Tax=Pedobacter sp. SYP-B3415 TaxID=2496641 RepID=UPI00101DE98D|nr:hypothetical protein [Pedobacter sp. SYP-B3415]
MKKVLLSLFTTAALALSAAAQTDAPVRLSVGADLAVPTGNFAILSGVGYGGSLKGEFKLAEKFNLTASAGYLSFPYKDVWSDMEEAFDIDLGSMNAVPVKGGAKYFFTNMIYGSAELGAAFTSGATAFIYVPSVGVSIPLKKNALDVDARYESWSSGGTTSFLGIRAAYSFRL